MTVPVKFRYCSTRWISAVRSDRRSLIVTQSSDKSNTRAPVETTVLTEGVDRVRTRFREIRDEFEGRAGRLWRTEAEVPTSSLKKSIWRESE